MARKLMIVVFILGLSVYAFAQKITSDDGKSIVYVTATHVNVRESPPSKGLILISGPGKELFKLKKDSKVVLLETKLIESVLSKTIWVKIRDQESKEVGWIYWGDEEKKSVNLTEVK